MYRGVFKCVYLTSSYWIFKYARFYGGVYKYTNGYFHAYSSRRRYIVLAPGTLNNKYIVPTQ